MSSSLRHRSEPDAPRVRPQVGQTWQHKDFPQMRLVIHRLAGRSVFGPMTLEGTDLTASGQVLYTQLKAKWELSP